MLVLNPPFPYKSSETWKSNCLENFKRAKITIQLMIRNNKDNDIDVKIKYPEIHQSMSFYIRI